jgi:hypothetical protein
MNRKALTIVRCFHVNEGLVVQYMHESGPSPV